MELKQQIEDFIIASKTDKALALLKNVKGLSKSQQTDIIILQQHSTQLTKDGLLFSNSDELQDQRTKLNIKIIHLTDDILNRSKEEQSAPNKFISRISETLSFSSSKETIDVERNELEKEEDNIRKALLERYESRLSQKTDHRLPIELKLTYTKEGTSEDYKHFDKGIRTSQKIKGSLVETLKKHQHLLIIGNPGAGKTTQLLELAKEWLDDNENKAIPIIFNLASWKTKDQHFQEWLQAALSSGYGFSKSLAQEAIEKQQILVLLDGLDEVGKDKNTDAEQIEIRNQCLHAIGRYINLFNVEHLAICSRKKEYIEVIDAPIKAEILVNPLSPKDIKRTLTDALAKKLAAKDETAANNLIQLLSQHPSLETVLCTPFYYNIALDVFDERTIEHDLPDDAEALGEYLVKQFVAKKLEVNKNEQSLSQKQCFHYLSWVASVLNKESTVSFELISFQPYHLDRKWRMNLVYCLVLGLIGGLVTVLTKNFFLAKTFGFDANLGLLNNLIGGLTEGLIGSFIFGFVLGSTLGFTSSLIFGLSINPEEIRKFNPPELLKVSTWIYMLLGGLLGGLFGGLFFGLNVGLIFGLIGGFSGGVIDKAFTINSFSIIDTPYRRLNSEIFSSSILSILMLTLIILIISYTNGTIQILTDFLLVLSIGIILGTAASLLSTAFFAHLILRICLYSENKMPLRWVRFFKYATTTRILEQDGGQWRFRHQILQDYFAERYKTKE